MSELIFKQIELAREWTIEVSESIQQDIVSVKPIGFNNTIHWQVGHILTMTEYFIYTIPDQINHLPDNYMELFGSNTSPDDWKEYIPTVDILVIQLREQLMRIKEIPASKFNQALKKPIHRFATFGDSAVFSVIHEALHIGKIEEMERVIVHS
jgi:hypothetical protein